MIYIAVDPGKETGIATRYEDGRIDTLTAIEWLRVPGWLRERTPFLRAELILEEFRNAGQSVKTAGDSWSTKLNGALEVLAFEQGWPVHYQTSSDAKVACSNKQLQEAGLWAGRSTHERDALRHLLLHCSSVLEPEARLWARRSLAGHTVDL